MNFNTRSLFIAAGIGAALQIVLVLLTQAGQFALLRSPMAENPLGIEGLARYSAIAAALVCLCGAATDLLAGAVYGGTHPREGLIAGDGVLGGAVSGAAARVVSGAVGVVISLLLMPLTYQRIQALGGGDLSTTALGPLMMFSLVGGVAGGICGIAVSAVFGALLGALSGGLLAAVRTRTP